MTTMRLWGRDLTVLYVDSAAGGANNGSSPTDALTALPAWASLAANTVYLVRRGNTQTLTPGANSNARIAVMAMPLASDPLYLTVPTQAITAWGADGGTYATINIAAGNALIAHTGNFVWLHGLAIVSPVTGTNVTAGNIRFGFTCNNVSITKCTYRMASYDATAATTAPGRASGPWRLSGNYHYVRDIDFQFCDDGSGTAWLSGLTQWFNVLGNDCVMERVACTVVGTYNGSALNYAFRITGERNKVRDVAINGVSAYTLNVGAACLPGGIKIDSGNYIEMTDVTYTYLRHINLVGTMTSQVFSNNLPVASDALVCAQNFHGAVFKSWTVDMVTNWTFTSGNSIIVNGIGIFESNLYNHDKPSIIDGMSSKFHDSYTGIGATSAAMRIDACATTIVRSPVAWMLNRIGLSMANTNDPNGGQMNASVDGADVKGQLFLAGGIRAQINVMVSTVSTLTPHVSVTNSGTGVVYTSASGQTECLISSLTLPVGQVTEQVRVDDLCTLAIESCNVIPVYTQGTTLTERGIIAINNEGGVTGSFRCKSLDNEVKTVNAYRTGGATAGVKLTPTAAGGAPAWMGPPALPALSISDAVVGAVGDRVITIYMAYKTYTNPPDPNNIWIELEVPNGGSGTKTRVISTRGNGNWEDDGASTWNNDSGLTLKKLRLQFPYDRAEGVKLRVGCDWWQSGAYALIDPKPVFS